MTVRSKKRRPFLPLQSLLVLALTFWYTHRPNPPEMPPPQQALHKINFQSRLPTRGFYAQGGLYHHCQEGEQARNIAKAYHNFTDIFDPAQFRKELVENNRAAFRSGRCRKNGFIAIPEPLFEPLRNTPLGFGQGW